MNNVIRKRFTPESDRVKVWTETKEDGDEQEFVRVPVSSTSEDRDGDVFSEKGLDSMQSQYESGEVGMFLDHGNASYDSARYPTKGIVGRWEGAERSGNTLFGVARLNKANEDADWLRDYLKEDMPVGFSVGFRAIDADGDRESGFEFHDVDLLETSAVGIPSNPDGVAAMSAETDEWREALDKELNMSSNDNTDTDADKDALRNLVKEVLEEEIGELKAQDDPDDAPEEETKDDEPPEWAKDLFDRLDAKEDDEDEDDDDEDDDEDEDDKTADDEDGDGGKTFTFSAESDAQIKALKDAVEESEDDDGTITLGESKTVTITETESDDDQAADDTPDWGI